MAGGHCFFGWRPLLIRLEALAIRLEAIASRLEPIASRLEAIASRLEAIYVVGGLFSVSVGRFRDENWKWIARPVCFGQTYCSTVQFGMHLAILASTSNLLSLMCQERDLNETYAFEFNSAWSCHGPGRATTCRQLLSFHTTGGRGLDVASSVRW